MHFKRPDTPKVPLPMETSKAPSNTRSLEAPNSESKLRLKRFRHFHTAHGGESPYLTMSIKKQLTCNLKN